jgi:hypothetical protein
MEPDEYYLVFREGIDWEPDTWYVVKSKTEAIEELVCGNASNVFPISEELYKEHKKLESKIAVARRRMRDIEAPYSYIDNDAFFDDPEYQEAYKFNEMWREAHRMNRDFDHKETYGIPEPDEPLAEWEKELLAASTKKETK